MQLAPAGAAAARAPLTGPARSDAIAGMRPLDAADPLSACLAALLELDAVPVEDPGLWPEWLASQNLRLTPAAELPSSGYWIGDPGDGRLVVMFGSPPDVVWDPAGAIGPGTPMERGLVLAALDPVLPARAAPSAAPATGTVEGIFVAPGAEAACVRVERAEAVPGRGLRGDRYFDGAGTFSPDTRLGVELTLIEAEALEELERDHGVALTAAEARRNVLTRGIRLDELVGREFTLGDVHCAGRRWCEPCAHLQRLTRDGTLRGLVHRGGLRADVLSHGEIAIGDRVTAI